MHHRKISEISFSFIDTETTALCPSQYGRVCEIGVVKKFPNGDSKSYSQLINPSVPIPYNATAIHGITNAMVACEPFFGSIAPELINLLNGSVLVFHNALFDVPFLIYEFAGAGLCFNPPVVLDTLKYARKYGNFTNNKLGNIAIELGVSNKGWHRALADAHMTEKVFSHFLDKFKTMGVKTLGELVELQTKGLKNEKTNYKACG